MLDRLLARFGYYRVTLATDKLMGGTDPVERGARWDQFYREKGGLGDMIQAIRTGYFEAAAALGVSDTDKLYEYALADRIAREIDREAQKVIIAGVAELAKRQQTDAAKAHRILRSI